ncbi:hypothetical protein [Guyparkeria sp. SCN-R1]|uniref:hypothetical protein n=1 Tax=Guyparkeria sp. SCN-R1 TaxID=2341113 RepID=UPI000F65289A|nr:hypothetical protein [Guyparkeria sp. SCN-R1]
MKRKHCIRSIHYDNGPAPDRNRPVPGLPTKALLVGGIAVGLACAGLLISGTVLAANPAIVALSDPQLAQMRGRFLAADNRVMYFGVEMITQWQTTGGTMAAGLSVGIDRAGRQPSVTFAPTVSIEGAPRLATSGSHGVVGSNTGKTRGVRQQVQVAGNDNRAANHFDVRIEPHSGGGTTSSSGYNVEIQQGGAVVASGLSNGGRRTGVSMQLGNSRVFQGFQSGNATQVIQLAGDHQVVNNQLRLVVGIDPGQMNNRERLQRQVGQSLATLRGGI